MDRIGAEPPSARDVRDSAEILADLADGMATVLRGKDGFVLDFLACAAAGGHLLVEDFPGLGKTTAAKTFAALLSGGPDSPALFRRLQCTPDLLPYDVTGVDVFDPDARAFVFHPGPVFANVLLADELNRTPPKVQSALLEAMAEGQVTTAEATRPLPEFFFVVATQNPVETEGTYPLPAAQLDRFLMRVSLGYPDREAELSILRDDPSSNVLSGLSPRRPVEDLLFVRKTARRVWADPRLLDSLVELVSVTRSHPGILLGASPRAALSLLAASRARALQEGRGFVVPQDIVDLAGPVLAHRLRPRDPGFDVSRWLREEAAARTDPLRRA
ncbi:MAG: AAA domain-containing protein [Treponema sp.]|nr:AAA domain-containing protein [Treponema sp.]